MSSGVGERLSSPGPLGHVESVFSHACNLLPHHSDSLLTIALPVVGRLPNGIHLRAGSTDEFTALRLAPGQPVYLSKREIVVPAACIAFDLSLAVDWRASFSFPPESLAKFEQARLNLRWAAEYVYCHAQPKGLVPLLRIYPLIIAGGPSGIFVPEWSLCGVAAAGITQLFRALQNEAIEPLIENLAPLIGLGLGLTPSCDDVLLGMLGALFAGRDRADGCHAFDLLSESISQILRPGLTTRVSYTALSHAVCGEFSEKLQQALVGLLTCTTFSWLEARLQPLLYTGATSGAELFLGMCLGLEWLSRQELILEG